jgi:hypothetical protein
MLLQDQSDWHCLAKHQNAIYAAGWLQLQPPARTALLNTLQLLALAQALALGHVFIAARRHGAFVAVLDAAAPHEQVVALAHANVAHDDKGATLLLADLLVALAVNGDTYLGGPRPK